MRGDCDAATGTAGDWEAGAFGVVDGFGGALLTFWKSTATRCSRRQ